MKAEVHWLAGPWLGRLGIVRRPRGGDWLEDEVRLWHDAGITDVVSLLTDEEIAELELVEEAQLCQLHGLAFRCFPIEDRGVPESWFAFLSLISDLQRALLSGRSVVVHCRQGIGRSALVVASLLALAGEEPEAAFRRIAEARGAPVPDTTDQREWVAKVA